MAYPIQTVLNDVTVNAQLADLSTASSCFIPCPVDGTLVRAYSTIKNAITVADAIWTIEINGTEATGSSTTVATASSAAGDVDVSTPTALNTVRKGDAIEFVSDGGSTTTCVTDFTAVIRVKS